MNTKDHCYPKVIILEAVYFKLRFTLSYSDVEEIIKTRGIQNASGFKSFESARRTLGGIEIVHMLRKNQMINPERTRFKSFCKLVG